jgi:ribonucleoside-diphosphate reductase beta chain
MPTHPQIDLLATPGLLTPFAQLQALRYPWAIEYWRRQQQIHWMPEEIPLGEDCKDWSSRMNDSERNLLTQVFRFFTQSDVEVQDNYMERYARVFRPTEIKMMLAAFANMETVHIAAYALLLETLGMPDSEFTAFMDYQAMRDKHDYLQGFGVDTHADVLRTLAMFGGFTEGLQLFASFADPAELPAAQQDARHGAGGELERARRDAALRGHHPPVPHLRAGDRRADRRRARRHRRLRAGPW